MCCPRFARAHANINEISYVNEQTARERAADEHDDDRGGRIVVRCVCVRTKLCSSALVLPPTLSTLVLHASLSCHTFASLT